MDFSYLDEQQKIIDNFKKLGKDLWKKESTIRALWNQPAVVSLFNLARQCLEQHPRPHADLVIALETLAETASEIGPLFSMGAHMFGCLLPILKFGNQVQKELYAGGLLNGTSIGGMAITEPAFGSDVSGIKTEYRKTNNGYVLNGEKTLITNAPDGDVFTVFARRADFTSRYDISAFIVEKKHPGLTRSEDLKLIGMQGATIGDLGFENCEVPYESLLCQEGRGLMIFNYAVQYERTCILALLVGAMARQLSLCIEFAKDRKQFGRAISGFQSVSNRIVDMKVRLEASRLILYKAAWSLDKGKLYAEDASIAKLFISENSMLSSIDSFRTLGGKGALSNSEAGGDVADSLLATIFSGTSDIQRLIIARHLGLK